MPEPLPAEVVAARLAETLALCGWEGVNVEQTVYGRRDNHRPALVFTAAALPPVRPALRADGLPSPYGAESSLTGARQRVRDRSLVIGAVLGARATESEFIDRANDNPEVVDIMAGRDRITGEVIPGEVDEP